MQLQYFLKYLSNAPILLALWLTFTGTLVAVFNYIVPDMLFFPFQ